MKHVVGAAVVLVLLVSLTAPAEAATDVHRLGYDSVDGDARLEYIDSTKYDQALLHSRREWNNLGRVTVQPDTTYRPADINYKDVNIPNGYVARYEPERLSADDINLNRYWMDSPEYNLDHEYNVLTHETGHALGIGDHYSSIYDGTVMFFHTHLVVAPQPHDIQDYRSIWGG